MTGWREYGVEQGERIAGSSTPETVRSCEHKSYKATVWEENPKYGLTVPGIKWTNSNRDTCSKNQNIFVLLPVTVSVGSVIIGRHARASGANKQGGSRNIGRLHSTSISSA